MKHQTILGAGRRTFGRTAGYAWRIIKRASWPRVRILIASVPRCGSTYLLRSLAGLSVGNFFPDERDCAGVHDFDKIPKRRFLKTHSIAPDVLPDDLRTVFLFGDPVAAIISTREKRYDRRHFANCGYTSDEPPQIYDRDDLGYERIFDTWMTPHRYPVLALRYETLPQYTSLLSDFLGIPITLQPQRPRTTMPSPELRERLSRTYGALIRKIDEAPDARVLSP